MRQKPFILLIFLIIIGFTTCGIDEYFYLPQIPQGSVSASGVTIMLPYLSSTEFYYASSYIIYYKIYLSNFLKEGLIETDAFSDISSNLVNDWNNLVRFLDITRIDVPSRSDFANRGYYELQFNNNNLLSIPGVTSTNRNMEIIFHATAPAEILIDNASEGKIQRNNNLELSPNPDFLSTPELRSNEDAGTGSIHNRDISPSSTDPTGTANYAYVSMYILTLGSNPTNFVPILSKPTHIGVFLLQPYL